MDKIEFHNCPQTLHKSYCNNIISCSHNQKKIREKTSYVSSGSKIPKQSPDLLLEFSGPSGARGEIHVCRTTTKRVDWRKRVRNQYIQHCIYTKSCSILLVQTLPLTPSCVPDSLKQSEVDQVIAPIIWSIRVIASLDGLFMIDMFKVSEGKSCPVDTWILWCDGSRSVDIGRRLGEPSRRHMTVWYWSKIISKVWNHQEIARRVVH